MIVSFGSFDNANEKLTDFCFHLAEIFEDYKLHSFIACGIHYDFVSLSFKQDIDLSFELMEEIENLCHISGMRLASMSFKDNTLDFIPEERNDKND